jgi:hypothetical protein
LKTLPNASKAVASITETHIAKKVKGQSRCILVPNFYLLMTAFPPKNFVGDLPFFCQVDGHGFFPDGSASLRRHGRRSNGYCQSAIATERFV